MSGWIEPAAELAARGEAFVRVGVAAVRGSAPREPGAWMIVTRDSVIGTVGGGNLEADCIAKARALLDPGAAPAAQLVRYPLSPGFGQCCGGVTTMLFERVVQGETKGLAAGAAHASAGEAFVVVTGAEGRHGGAQLVIARDAVTGTLGDPELDADTIAHARTLLASGQGEAQLRTLEASGESAVLFVEPVWPSAMQVVLFGAGHVGRALVKVLADLDCQVTWVDSRAGEFPATAPANARVVVTDAPELEVDHAPSDAYFLVMTHSHAIDFELCERILKRGDFVYLGLIGSMPKRNRFVKYLQDEGVTEAAIARLTCPIGVAGITGKRPATIAVAVAAQLLQVRGAAGASGRSSASSMSTAGTPAHG